MQPGAKEGSGFHAFRENPSTASDERRLPQSVTPGDEDLRRKASYDGVKPSGCCAVAWDKLVQSLAVSQIQAATASHEKFASQRRHVIVNGNGMAGRSNNLRRHKTRRTAAYD